MKKSLFFVAAASALMLTACSSDSDVLQSAAQLQQSEPKAVGFDVYTQNATEVTRAGYSEGVMNTSRLQKPTVGFGIFGYYTDQTDATARVYPHTTGADATNDYIPNFMWNEHVTWNNTNKGWVYSPLKYWPNETQKDSQSNPAVMDGTTSLLDQLTFFAYAPYVADGSGTEGIRAITQNTGVLTTVGSGAGAQAKGDPAIEYKSAASVVNGVDLLWGVAPAGGLHYTAVNGDADGANEGLPYIDLVKPDVNTSLKFNFQHALARFGFTVAAAIDQVPQGGTLDPETKVTVDQVDLTGYFAQEGILNLNNPVANVANWTSFEGTALAAGSALNTAPLAKRTLSITTDIADDIEDSRTDALQTVEGVIGAKKDLIQARYYAVETPTTFKAGDKYYTSAGVPMYANYTGGGTKYVLVDNDYMLLSTSQYYGAGDYYTLTPSSAITVDPAGSAVDYYYKLVSGSYIRVAYASISDWGTTNYYTLTPATTTVATSDFTWPAGSYYKLERSYFMVVPTNNVPNICTTNFGAGQTANLLALRTVWVTITYYVTTKDTKLAGGKSRIKNVITQKVELPSLDNGKSYNLHLLLGLTSVKVEAEVGDWSEEFIQTDLPQNTPGE